MPLRNESPLLPDETVARLDAAENTLLAPVRGDDSRRSLPRHYFGKRPSRFAAKFIFSLCVIGLCWTLIAWQPGWPATVVAALVTGLMFAHLVELQHECLHEHAFASRARNRACGIVCGVFMLSSFWHYKHDHLRHHAFLGTPQNREFFNYKFRDLDRWHGAGFVLAALNLGRYRTTGADIVRAWSRRPIPSVPRARDSKKIKSEYRLLAVLAVAAVAYTAVTGDLFLVWAWLLPAILVAEPAHFLIELPEHFGLNTQSDPNVLANTRTVSASRFAQWYTNFNNLHTAHHYHQGVPMAQIEGLHALIADRVVTVEPSYWAFYRKVMTGRIKYQSFDETCMTR